MRIREGFARPGALADPTHAVQEEAAFWRGQHPRILAACHDVVILPRKMTTWLHNPAPRIRGLKSCATGPALRPDDPLTRVVPAP